MKKRYLCMALLWAACDEPACTVTDPVLLTSGTGTARYNEALAQSLAGEPYVTYWITSYRDTDSRTYLLLNAHGRRNCAALWLDVTDGADGRLDLSKEKKGVSFVGACVKGLRYRVLPDSGYRFVYAGSGGILD